jgi:PPOX class probable F420-dependent enzyme
MTPAQKRAFLKAPHLADLATLLPDGSPHATPVWHHYERGRFYVLSETTSVKVRNIERDPRVCLTVASREQPYAYIMAMGEAELERGRIPELVLKMSMNYLGEDEGRRYAKSVADVDFVVIALKPSKTIAWSGD